MKIIFAVIKSALVGGGIVGGCYGTYKFVDSVKDIGDSEGINIFQSIKDAYDTASNAATSSSSIDLEMLGSAATLLNDETLVTNIVNNMKEIKNIIQDKEKLEILTKIFEGCIKSQNKQKDSCKDLGKTLKTISSMPSSSGSSTSFPTLPGSSSLPFLQVNQQQIMQIVKNSDPIKVVEYFEQTEKLATYKSSIQDSVPDMLKGAAGAFGDAMSSLHSWLAIKNAQKNLAKNTAATSTTGVVGMVAPVTAAGSGVAATTTSPTTTVVP